MNKLILQDLYSQTELHVVIDSYEGGIYQAFVNDIGGERLIWLDDDTPLKTRSLIEICEQLESLSLCSLQLRQQSAYDEMVGQPLREADNTLTVPLYPQTNLPPTGPGASHSLPS